MEKDETKRPTATELLDIDYLTLHRRVCHRYRQWV